MKVGWEVDRWQIACAKQEWGIVKGEEGMERESGVKSKRCGNKWGG